MKLYLDDVEFDIEEALGGVTIGDLMKLKVKTKTDGFLGITVKSIRAGFMRVGQAVQDAEEAGEEFDTLELLGDVEFLQCLQGLIYLVRRKAGEQLEPADAADVAFKSIRFEGLDDEGDGTDDPKAPEPSEPEGNSEPL